MTRSARSLLPALLLVLAVPVFSAPLLDNAVTGTLQFGSVTNYFDPANGFVPGVVADPQLPAPANSVVYFNSPTVTIPALSVPAWAFGFNSGAYEIDIYFDSGLNRGYQFTVSQVPVVAGPAVPWTITLDWTSDPVTDIFGVVTGNPFVPDLLVSSTGPRNVTLNFAGTGDEQLPVEGYSLTFLLRNLSDVPEPATPGLVFVGLAGLGLVSRKRRR